MKRKGLIVASIISLVGIVSLSASLTYASFVNFKKISQPIGYDGKLVQKTIYFNSHIWETADAVMGMYAFNNNVSYTWISPVKVITPTINNVTFKLYIFAVNEGEYTYFNFARLKPTTATGYDDGNNGYNWTNKWNQTRDITYTLDSVNYYCITSWNGDNNDSSYSTGYLYVNNNNQLAFR